MIMECLACGATLDERALSCTRCGTANGLTKIVAAKPQRKRLSIPFATILAVGFASALAMGGGKSAQGQSAPAGAVSASINGRPVEVGGPAIALIERQFRATSSRHH